MQEKVRRPKKLSKMRRLGNPGSEAVKMGLHGRYPRTMKLQKFPILAAAIFGALSAGAPELWAHGGGHSGGGGARVGGGGGFAGGGARFAGGAARFGGARFAGRPAIVGQRFHHFANRRGFNTVVIAGSPGYYNYPYYGGYYPYGYYNNPTYAASNAYYPDYTMTAPGVFASPPTLVAGDVVANVQRFLRYRGFYRGPVDGLSGPATRAAIRAYAASVGLPPTGVIDARLLISMQLM